jgi:hypothetical protein
MSASAVFIADTLPVAENPHPVSVGIEVAETSGFRKGARYLFDVAVENANAPIVGRMLDSRPVE